MRSMKFILLLVGVLLLIGCQEHTYTLTYTIEGNSYQTINVPKGLYQESPTPEAPQGYYFDGWFYDIDYDLPVELLYIESNTSLYGRFLIYPEVEALNALIISASTNQNINLPTLVGSYQIEWSSSDSEILSPQGEYQNQTLQEQPITLTAHIVGTEFTREFAVLVAPFPAEARAQEVFNAISFSTITTNLFLPTHYDVFQATWSSTRKDIIGDNGVVHLTLEQEEVTLTLELTYQTTTFSETFTVYTKARDLTVEDAGYFAKQVSLYGKTEDELIMNEVQIASFNQTVLATSGTNTANLALISETITRSTLTTQINAYQLIDRYPIYHETLQTQLSSSDKTAILNNRNLGNIAEVVNIQYAISTTHTNLRSYPTHHYSNSSSVDRFQETGFGVGIPMVVYHTSLDSEWLFVRMFNYAGWVPTSSVGLCSRNVFLSYVTPSSFITITTPVLMIQNQPLRMGTILPSNELNQIAFPKRLANGSLIVEYVSLEADAYHIGYLPMTYRNLFTQAYLLLGYTYSWGDKNPLGFDCSSTQSAIYACFGLRLGRNTSNQWATATYGKSISSASITTLSSYLPGTLFYTTSHVLMYLGQDAEGVAWLLHNTSSGNICKLQTLSSYGTSTIKYVLEIHP